VTSLPPQPAVTIEIRTVCDAAVSSAVNTSPINVSDLFLQVSAVVACHAKRSCRSRSRDSEIGWG
jgi:hypothetical protein